MIMIDEINSEVLVNISIVCDEQADDGSVYKNIMTAMQLTLGYIADPGIHIIESTYMVLPSTGNIILTNNDWLVYGYVNENSHCSKNGSLLHTLTDELNGFGISVYQTTLVRPVCK